MESKDNVIGTQIVSHDSSSSASSQSGYMPLREAAKWAGVSARTMKRWLKRGLPGYQAGPREKVLVRREDMDTFLRAKLYGK